MPDFGPFLQAELNKRGWSYSDLARHAGLHISLVSRLARGQRRPTVNALQRCATALALPLSDLLIAAGLWEEAVAVHEGDEAQALQKYVQYARTKEGEDEIDARLPEKLARVRSLPDGSGKLALLLDWVMQLLSRFRQASGAERALIGGALLYFISPVDLVPDFIPVSGLLDDLAVVVLVLGMLSRAG
jgi:transcriptional regulator with XRE-family HTH domain